MEFEKHLRDRFQEDAVLMRPKHLDLRSTLSRGRRSALLRSVAIPVAAACLLAAGWVGYRGVFRDDKGHTVTAGLGNGAIAEADQDAAAATLKAFVTALGEQDENSWRYLSPRAQDEIGSQREWQDEKKRLGSFLEWVPTSSVDVLLIDVPVASDDRYVAVAVAPATPHRALLQPVPLTHEGDEWLIDITPDELLFRPVSLEPLAPRFSSGVSGEELSWPEISGGDALSVAVEPASDVREVFFAVSSEWAGQADLIEEDDRFLAEGTFDSAGVTSGEQILLVVIVRIDGSLVTYGYRVDVVDG